MLGIGLREHHQFGVGRVAAELAVALAQVVHFVVRQGQAEARIGLGQFAPAECAPVRPAGSSTNKRGGVARDSASSDCVIGSYSSRASRAQRGSPSARQAGQVDAQAALDPLHGMPGAAQDFGGLARPGRHGAQARRDEAALRRRLRRLRGRAAFQDPAQRWSAPGDAPASGCDEVDVPGAGDAKVGNDLAQAGLKTVAAKGRQGRQALEDDHVRGYPWKTSRLF